MGKFDDVLLLSDFDGTLTNSKGEIPESNISAIKYFISEGGTFSVSTGRTRAGFHNFSSEFINAPVLLANGAEAYDYVKKETVFFNSIGAENLDILNRILNDNSFVSMELYSCDGKTYAINPNEASFKHFEALKIKDFSVIDELCADIFPLVKIMLSVGKRSSDIQNYLRTIDLLNMKFIPCTGEFVEILSENSGKGRGLSLLSQTLGKSDKNTFAIGDGSNDVDMLESAYIGFSPCNADALALKAADRVVCTNDEGCVAAVIGILSDIYCQNK